MQDYAGYECSNDELINMLTLYSYNDRLVEKKDKKYIQNTILIDFVESNLKGVNDYMRTFQIIYD